MRAGGGSIGREGNLIEVEAVPIDEEGEATAPIMLTALDIGWENLGQWISRIYSFEQTWQGYGRDWKLVTLGESRLGLGQTYAIRARGLQFVAMPQSVQEHISRGQFVSETVLADLGVPDYPWGRRFRAGFWPWEEGWAVGEANLVWQAIGELEGRVERLEQSLTRLEALLSRWERLQSALSALFGGEDEDREGD